MKLHYRAEMEGKALGRGGGGGHMFAFHFPPSPLFSLSTMKEGRKGGKVEK